MLGQSQRYLKKYNKHYGFFLHLNSSIYKYLFDYNDMEPNYKPPSSLANLNIEKNKSYEERKLVEESDLAISKELFGNEAGESSNYKQNENGKTVEKKVSKQFKNKLSQKELSIRFNEKKQNTVRRNTLRQIELYGACDENEESYDDKYENYDKMYKLK